MKNPKHEPIETSETVPTSDPKTEGIFLGTGSAPLSGSSIPVESAESRESRIRGELQHRFMVAVNSTPPSPAQRAQIVSHQHAVVSLAELIVLGTPEGREQSLALTKLEEALMWANKAVFRA